MLQQRPSKRQQELLNFLDGFIKGNGYGPSYREIMRALGYKSVSTVATHIDGLIARGFVRKKDNSARSLEIITSHVSAAQPAAGTSDVTHEAWLNQQLARRIEEYNATPTDQLRVDIHTLVEALRILGFAESYKIAQEQVK